MGCDIHSYAETKNKDGKWEQLGQVFDNPYYNPERAEGWDYAKQKKTVHPFDLRNYALFALLAGVRNYDDVEPISEPKGMPDDCDEAIRKEAKEWGGDGHSHSYLSLKELQLAAAHEEEVTVSGIIGEGQYKELKAGKLPQGYCRSIGGWGIKQVSNEEMDDIISGKKPREVVDPGKTDLSPDVADGLKPQMASYHTLASWKETRRDFIGDRFYDTVKRLEELAPDGDPERIRVVFWFDN